MAIPDVSQKTLAELISLRGRNAVITGGARGIGLAIAQRLAEAGAGVLLGDVRTDEGQAAAERLAARYQVQALFASVDVTDSDSVRKLAQRAAQELGSLDIWVNNAGIYPSSPALEMSDEQWDRVLAINLRGTFLGAREAARCMIQAQRGGVIINLASTAGYQGGA
ncbi:MAG: SDR family NAD(P)-dependent oxidoreductase, partial [Thermogemmatispora sp.]|uniref:SDR family NAD(P)-dependent oxidoreductase n=1 Tax=Thermogemmatispora sp. TaxID=1968838 RepID=UPI0019EAE1E8